MKYILVFLFATAVMFSKEKETIKKIDSVVCFNKVEITILANKIQTLKDSIDYLKLIVNEQDTLVNLYKTQMNWYNMMLSNRQKSFDACRIQSDALQKTVDELQPHWYDNTLLWFMSGAATVVSIILVTK